jgi:hypothetical protein
MCHVNGYARNGKLEIAWPFAYINTNLDFTTGSAYGNILIPPSDPRSTAMLAATQRLLSTLPTPDHLIFHLELFETVTTDSKADLTRFEYVLCEIAARRPGGSIGPLITLAEGGPGAGAGFPEMEFRLSVGLSPGVERKTISRFARGDKGFCVGDLIVPRRIGTLVKVITAIKKNHFVPIFILPILVLHL